MANSARAPELAAELLACRGVEGRERLVEQQHGAARGQRPGQGDPLLLAPRDLVRPAVLQVREVRLAEELGDPSPPRNRPMP